MRASYTHTKTWSEVPGPGPGLGEVHLGEGGSPCSLPAPDYKNNILKERAELAHSPLPAKNVDLDRGEWLGG